ncbi:Uncharacterised protein [Candidatus Bartonella washoeensis]|nr:hypothetical protein [Bartonella washoeensis]SPU26117.1 Uncharacterised protein [Bartonella washoeensis]
MKRCVVLWFGKALRGGTGEGGRFGIVVSGGGVLVQEASWVRGIAFLGYW